MCVTSQETVIPPGLSPQHSYACAVRDFLYVRAFFGKQITPGPSFVRSVQNRRLKMSSSSADEPLLGAPSRERPKYKSVNSDTTAAVTLEPPSSAARDDAYRAGHGSGCVSFHNISYEVSGCFGLKGKKVILNSVR